MFNQVDLNMVHHENYEIKKKLCIAKNVVSCCNMLLCFLAHRTIWHFWNHISVQICECWQHWSVMPRQAPLKLHCLSLQLLIDVLFLNCITDNYDSFHCLVYDLGSCVGKCGGYGGYGCYCDEYCNQAGKNDCCDDIGICSFWFN